jgi:alpha-glucosidase
VAEQESDPRSMLALHRRLLALRRSSADLLEGAYETVAAGGGVLVYRRGARTAVSLNLTSQPAVAPVSGSVAMTTELDGREGEVVEGSLLLRPGEGAITAAG